MIPLTDTGWQGQSWQYLIRHAVRDINELVSLLHLDEPPVETDFPLLVPLPYLARMEHGNPEDPLLLQVLPTAAERLAAPGFTTDPLAESAQSPLPGLIHKYPGRVLVVTTGACAVNCRYCFRRHFPYESFQPDSSRWTRILDYIRADESITEVILSGGDPLVLPDKRLQWIAERLSTIPHVDTLRLHSRLPVVIPARVCDALITWIKRMRLTPVLVIHANHARELDDEVAVSMARLADAGVTLLNQSVLLRHVNDSADALTDLSRRLFDIGVLPYYLHLLDPVAGAAHFEVEDRAALEIMKEVAARLPGYLVPKLVREVPGETAKVPVGP